MPIRNSGVADSAITVTDAARSHMPPAPTAMRRPRPSASGMAISVVAPARIPVFQTRSESIEVTDVLVVIDRPQSPCRMPPSHPR